jgi:hypothetical protein
MHNMSKALGLLVDILIPQSVADRDELKDLKTSTREDNNKNQNAGDGVEREFMFRHDLTEDKICML